MVLSKTNNTQKIGHFIWNNSCFNILNLVSGVEISKCALFHSRHTAVIGEAECHLCMVVGVVSPNAASMKLATYFYRRGSPFMSHREVIVHGMQFVCTVIKNNC